MTSEKNGVWGKETTPVTTTTFLLPLTCGNAHQ